MNKEYSIIGILVVIAIILIYFRAQIFGVTPGVATNGNTGTPGYMPAPAPIVSTGGTGQNIAPTNQNDVIIAGINAGSDLIGQFAALNTGEDNSTL